MATYICILRGINVSGSKPIKMDALRTAFEALGFSAVHTYIQSGNIIFQHKTTKTAELEKRVHKKILDSFGFDVPVLVKTIAELEQIILANPFVQKENNDIASLYVTFLASVPAKEHIAQLEACQFPNEAFVYTAGAVYLYVPRGYGNAKLSNNLIEGKLKVRATTRNWKTTLELLNLARKS